VAPERSCEFVRAMIQRLTKMQRWTICFDLFLLHVLQWLVVRDNAMLQQDLLDYQREPQFMPHERFLTDIRRQGCVVSALPATKYITNFILLQNCFLWQCHSSKNYRRLCMTIKSIWTQHLWVSDAYLGRHLRWSPRVYC
jgi:hypothetical protein